MTVALSRFESNTNLWSIPAGAVVDASDISAIFPFLEGSECRIRGKESRARVTQSAEVVIAEAEREWMKFVSMEVHRKVDPEHGDKREETHDAFINVVMVTRLAPSWFCGIPSEDTAFIKFEEPNSEIGKSSLDEVDYLSVIGEGAYKKALDTINTARAEVGYAPLRDEVGEWKRQKATLNDVAP